MQRIANPSWGNTHARVQVPVSPPKALEIIDGFGAFCFSGYTKPLS